MGGPGSGRHKEPKQLFKDAIERINDHEIIDSLMNWARGKEVVCPFCNKPTGAFTADTVALQSAVELLNRKRGKVPQSVQLDVTQTILLNADQIDQVLRNHLPQIAETYKIELERLLLPEGGLTNGSNKGTEEGVSARVHEEEEV